MNYTRTIIISLAGGYFLMAGVSAKAPTTPVYAVPPRLVPAPSQQASFALQSKPIPLPEPPKISAPVIEARAAVVLEGKTGAIWYVKNEHQVLPLASLTKLMSALVFLRTEPALDQPIAIVAEDFNSVADYGSDEEPIAKVNLRAGERIRLQDVLYAALIPSANNAIMTLVRSTGLPVEEFVRLMNQEALRLNLLTARFVDPTGLERTNQASALEVARLARYVFNQPVLEKPLGIAHYSFVSLDEVSHTVETTNRLLGRLTEVTAGKTGYISESGYNLAVKAEKNGKKIIVVVLGAPTLSVRFTEVEKLVRWALR